MEERIDLSMKDITLYELDEYYGKSILNKQVTLYANDEGVIVDGFTQSGKLKDILNNSAYGDFFSEMKVVLLEKVDGRLYIDYEWNEEARTEYLRSEIKYLGSNSVYHILSKNHREAFGKGYDGYMDMIKYIRDNATDVMDLLDMIDAIISTRAI